MHQCQSPFFGGGGGIFHIGAGTLYIINTDVSDNSATGGNGGSYGYGTGGGGVGGAGAALGGAVFNYSGTVLVTDSTFYDNAVAGGEGPDNAEFGADIAAAIFNWDVMQFENSTVPNQSPVLENYEPTANALNISIDQSLSWDVTELDGDDILYGYDAAGLTVTVAFGDDPLNLLQATGVVTSYVPSQTPLQPSTTYYWEVTATDGISITNSGIMSFTTAPLPTVDFTAVSPQGARPFNASFTNNTIDADSYLWDFGDGDSSTAVHPSHNYANSGTYSVTLQATGLGGTSTFTRTNYIFVYDLPESDFTASPLVGLPNLDVQFDNLSQFSDSYLWEFGDGQSSSDVAPAHQYTSPGTYTVTLAASNPAASDSMTNTAYITVYPQAVADFSATSRIGTKPLNVEFSNLSTEADAFIWDYGDGVTSTVTATVHSYTYAAVREYDVTLTAVNPYSSDVKTRLAYVPVYEEPVASFLASPVSGIDPLLVEFTNYSLYDTTAYWDFGDGSSSTSLNPAHLYLQPGVYTVTLTAINGGGSDTLVRAEYIEVNSAPQAEFTADVQVGTIPLAVIFTNSSTDADSVIWEYGDGNSSNNADPSHAHQYNAPGVYTVQLIVTNAYATVTQTEVALITVYETPVADFEAAIDFGASPLSVGFANLSTAATDYLWDFGDGNTSSAATPTHIYTQGGTYTVSLTASNPVATDTAVKTAFITVYDEPIADFSAAPRIGAAPLLVTFQQESQFADDYLWEYGDGDSSTETAVAHTYLFTEPGLYTVTLTADNAYATDSKTRTAYITVIEPPVTTAYFVDATEGSNGGDGSQTNPWQTISYALSQAIGPDVNLYVATGLYDEALGESFPITMEPRVSLLGADWQSTIIAGNGADAVILFPETSVYTATTMLNGFKIIEGKYGVRVDGSSSDFPSPTIDGNWITENEQGVYTFADSSRRAFPIISNNRIDYNDLYGINNYAGYNGTNVSPIIDGNRIAYNGQSGIRCYAQGSGSSGGLSRCSPKISNNEIVYNDGDGIFCQTYYAGR